MKIVTYQSIGVLKILLRGEIYRAKPSISFAGEYGALIDLLGLQCDCPVFGVVKGRKQNTGGKVSGAVRISLDVPDKHIKLTEYSVWADFLYAYKFTKPGNYKALQANTGEIGTQRYKEILNDLRHQKKLKFYKFPQAVLEKINPTWMIGHKTMSAGLWGGHLGERIGNVFRK